METDLNLDPDSNPDPNPELITDQDPNLQIILDPSGSGCTTLILIMPPGNLEKKPSPVYSRLPTNGVYISRGGSMIAHLTVI